MALAAQIVAVDEQRRMLEWEWELAVSMAKDALQTPVKPVLSPRVGRTLITTEESAQNAVKTPQGTIVPL